MKQEQRTIDRTDNSPPEALPPQLATVDDIAAMIGEDVTDLERKALDQLATYARMPAEVGDDAVYERATTLGTLIKGVLDEIDRKRKEVKAPYQAASTAIDRAFKLPIEGEGGDERQLVKELETAHAGIKNRLSAYDTIVYKREEARREEERKRLAAEAAKDGVTMNAVADAGTGVEVVRSQNGGAAVRNVVTTWEVVDEAKLPRSVLSVDRAKVEALIENGASEIPGIVIDKQVQTHVKRR